MTGKFYIVRVDPEVTSIVDVFEINEEKQTIVLRTYHGDKEYIELCDIVPHDENEVLIGGNV